MEELFIPYTEALALKKLEFDEPCFRCYDNTNLQDFINFRIIAFTSGVVQNENLSGGLISAPLWQQAFDFFNEKFKLASHVDIFAQTHLGDNYYYQIVNFADFISPETTMQVYGFKTSYDAKLACLKKLITFLQ